VRALTRDPDALTRSERVESVVGDATDPAAVSRAVAGVDVVISAVGPRANDPAAVEQSEAIARNVVMAMREHHVPRVVFVAGAGISLDGERRSLTQRLATAVVRVFARWVVRAKEREMDVYRASELAWSAVRPTRVARGPRTGRVRITDDRPSGFQVTSGDVAEVMLRLAEDPASQRRAPFVSTTR
jgi:putative NADH-flavin reductase